MSEKKKNIIQKKILMLIKNIKKNIKISNTCFSRVPYLFNFLTRTYGTARNHC